MSESAEQLDGVRRSPVAVLSPHLDDAVLSCWHLIEAEASVTVVNVFTGSPPPDTPTPWWDRITGATDPVSQMGKRREEDRQALSLAGWEAIAVDLLDAQYRREELSPAVLVEELGAVVPRDALVYAPAAMSGHPDHVLVRDAAVALARTGFRLALYADLPHSIAHGWPTWVTGQQAMQSGVDVDSFWAEGLARSGLAVDRLVAQVYALDAQTRERKLDAVAAYETQRSALDGLAFVPLDDPGAFAWEVTWLVPPSALGRAPQTGGHALVADAGRKPLDDLG
jgi:LmbE family N-acetylglucosaminyl deacetylase